MLCYSRAGLCPFIFISHQNPNKVSHGTDKTTVASPAQQRDAYDKIEKLGSEEVDKFLC